MPKISELTNEATPTTSAVVPIVQSGSTLKTTLLSLFDTLTAYIHSGVGAVYRTITDKFRDTINAKDFGATGDGVTDDTAALQLAIKAAANAGVAGQAVGKTLYIPAGVYCITGLYIYSNTHIYFDPQAKLKMTADGFALKTASAQSATGITSSSPIRRVMLDNPWIDMASFQGVAIMLECATESVVRHARIENVGNGNFTYDDGNFSSSSYESAGIYLKGITDISGSNRFGCYYNRIEHAKITGTDTTGGIGIWLGTSIGGETQRANFNLIEQPIIETIGEGIAIKLGGDNRINMPEVSTCDVGIRIGSFSLFTSDSRRNHIVHAYLELCASAGIDLEANARDTYILGLGSTSGTTTVITGTGSNTANTTFIPNNSDTYTTTNPPRFYEYGLRFAPAIDSTDKDTNVNAFDDYQEGTFTPVIEGTTATGAGTYTTQLGDYTLIGNRCFFNISLVWTAHTGTGNMLISGLPFTAETGGRGWPLSIYTSSVTSPAGAFPVAMIRPNSKIVDMFSNLVAGGGAAALAIDTAGTMYISGSYLVNH